MSELERSTKANSAEKYIAATRDDVGIKPMHSAPPSEERIIDEDTERTLVSIISAAIVAAPLIVMASKLLPDIPIYQIYQIYRYIPF